MKQSIHTDNAPAALGPYSQAVKNGNMVFFSGQVGIDPATQKLVDGGVEAQARQVLKNLKSVAEAAGLTLDHVVKTTVYLADFGDYAAVNAIYAEYFKDTPPARAAIAVSTLPAGALVEIDAIAVG